MSQYLKELDLKKSCKGCIHNPPKTGKQLSIEHIDAMIKIQEYCNHCCRNYKDLYYEEE